MMFINAMLTRKGSMEYANECLISNYYGTGNKALETLKKIADGTFGATYDAITALDAMALGCEHKEVVLVDGAYATIEEVHEDTEEEEVPFGHEGEEELEANFVVFQDGGALCMTYTEARELGYM